MGTDSEGVDVTREDWKLQVLSHERVLDWTASARQLKAFMDALSDLVEAGPYGEKLSWKSYEEMDVDLWPDLGRVEQELLAMRDTNDDGTLAGPNPDSRIVVQAYLDRGTETDYSEAGQLINLRAVLGHDPQFSSIGCQATFSARRPDQPAQLLSDHDPAWLVELLCTAAASVNADQARIDTRSVFRALRARVDLAPLGLGILSLAPYGIDLDPLPTSLTAYPCPTGYPDGQVIVADLERAATDPESLVDDLLILNDAIETAAAQHHP
ncbi:hypothetical protein [Microlunatus sp. GCM10028923]|uniref:hypothetical protein n=1 Tax=Microlunatus sp. GCM10028923 TaxID=3273400 RepID=UPI003618BF25